jgi:hypothetical protein
MFGRFIKRIYLYTMKNTIIAIFLSISIGLNAQIIDFNNFSEKTMNEVMFKTMNEYVKKIHNGDSLILSSVVQEEIMPDNYNFIKNNITKPLITLHNPKWLGRPGNDLPDILKKKIANEIILKYPHSNIIKTWNEEYKVYTIFTYVENIASLQFISNIEPITYQTAAQKLIECWSKSPGHAIYMNANYGNSVVVGVISYFEKRTKTIIVSFVYVDFRLFV